MRNNIFFLLLTGLLFWACQDDKKTEFELRLEPDAPLIGYINDPDQEFSETYIAHVSKVAEYTKIGIETLSIGTFESKPIGKNIRVLLINGTKGLSDNGRRKLLKFVASGGTVIFPTVNEDPKATLLSGLKADANMGYNLVSQGISFKTEMLPGVNGLKIYEEKKNTSLSKENFSETVIIHATSANDSSQPIIIEHNIGDGRLFHFNTSILFQKADRGLLFAAILRGLEGVPFPIVNVASIFLDDFPMPLYETKTEPVYSRMGLTSDQFVLNVWWPDMIDLAKNYDLKYAAYPCFDYNRTNTAPFSFEEWDRHQTNDGKNKSSSTFLANEVIDEGHELAIHGFNHESLMKEIWPSGEEIESSYKAVRKKWTIGNMGKLPVSYVPPSNEIDSFGISHLHRSMPELKYICSTYDGDFNLGGDREFDPEPYENSLFGYPRVSSGYTFDDKKQYSIQSLFLYAGIWTHFVHPDDVFQLPDSSNTSAGKYDYRNAQRLNWRSSRGKKGMSSHYEDYLKSFISLHPSVEFLTVTEGGERTKRWRDMKVNSNEGYRIANPDLEESKYSWHIYVENSELASSLRTQAINLSSTKMGKGMLLTVITDQPALNMPNIQTSTQWSNAEVDELLADFVSAGDEDESSEYEEQADELIEDEQESEEEIRIKQTIALEEQVMSGQQLDSNDFQKLIVYWLDQDRELEIWNYLETQYQKDSIVGVDLHNKYQNGYEYPNDSIAKIWLERVLMNKPNNREALTVYKNYLTDDDLSTSEFLKYLQKRNAGNKYFYAEYIQYLIDFQSQKVTTELADKDPEDHSELWPMSNAIAYVFAGETKYEEALSWSVKGSVPLLTKLQWWAELEAYNSMQDEYDLAGPEEKTDTTIAFVSNIWLDLGRVKKSAFLANQMNEGEPKESYKNRLNTELPNIEVKDQWYLIEKTPNLIIATQGKVIKRNVRLAFGDAVEYTSSYVFDNFGQSNWDNTLTYHLRTPKRNLHSFSTTHSYVSDIQLNEVDLNNIDHTLVGFGYQFQTEENTTKPVFYANGGLMQDFRNITFFRVGAGVSHSTNKTYKSAGILHTPMMTGPSLSREIYKTELTGYLERDASHFLQPSIAVVGTNYATGANSLELTGRTFFNIKRTRTSRFSPFIEAYGTLANENQLDGNPFWIIEDRVYAGGGTAWTHGLFSSPLYVRFEGGIFADTFTDYFVRVNGEARYLMKDYTYLTARFEVFNQARYYSNAFFIGIKHYLKPRKRRFRDSDIFKD